MRWLLLIGAFATGCGPARVDTIARLPATDAAPAPPPASCADRTCSQDAPCPANQTCAGGFCFPDAVCTDDNSCPGDTRCQDRVCVPYDDPCLRGPAFDPACATDLTGRLAPPLCDGSTFTLRGSVCNRGAARQADPTSATFYDGSPQRDGTPLCTAAAPALGPGDCRDISCSIPGGAPRFLELHLQVGDDGAGTRLDRQCRLGNDLASLPRSLCGPRTVD